jgi:hypothetical protein
MICRKMGTSLAGAMEKPSDMCVLVN